MPLSIISDRSFWNTHGNKQLTRQPGTYLGEFYFAICLQRLLNDLKEESATMIGDFPYLRAVAAPILLPHNITFELVFCKKWTTVATCSDYLTPRLIVLSSWLWPHPMKSKEANENLKGRYLIMLVHSILEEELPCR